LAEKRYLRLGADAAFFMRRKDRIVRNLLGYKNGFIPIMNAVYATILSGRLSKKLSLLRENYLRFYNSFIKLQIIHNHYLEKLREAFQ